MERKIIYIELHELFGNQITSRSIIMILETMINNNQLYYLNFDKIDFISRNAAHELLKIIQKAKENNISVSLINTNSSISEMIKSVEISLNNNVKHATYVEHIKFDTEKELDEYLLMI